MSRPLLIFSQSDYLIQFTYLMANSADPASSTDLDLHCLQRQDISASAGLGLKGIQTNTINIWFGATESF